MARRSSNLWTQLRLDITLVLLLALVAAGYYLQDRPLLLHSKNPEVNGTQPPPSPAVSDNLLILPALPPVPAASFSRMDMSMGWFNTLDQELGSFRHTTAPQFGDTHLAEARLVVVAASASRSLTQSQIQVLGRWLQNGGVLLIEQPDDRWQELLQVKLDGELKNTLRLTGARGVPTRGALRDALLESPVLTWMRSANLTSEPGTLSPNILLEVDGKPALIHRARGRGHAYVLTIDLARAITTLQQGRPREDFSLPAIEGNPALPPGTTQPWVAVAEEKMLDNQKPYADLLERNIMEITSREVPLPRLWYFPGTLMGAYIMSHDEESFGDKSLFQTDWEHEQGEVSTMFVIPGPMSRASMEKMRDQGHDVQVHWNRGFMGTHTQRTVGLGPWQPLALEMNLREQRLWIEERLGGRSAALNRVHGLVWDQDWSASFRKLASAQFAADSTYGPTGPKQFGYLFGTGLPFYPLDRSGLLLPVAEVPFLFQDDENLSPKLHKRLVAQSESGYHQVIMPIFHSNTMANRPSVEVLQSWREIFDYARRHNHWVTTLQDYLLFVQARRQSTYTSRFSSPERRLDIQVNLVRPRIEPAREEERPAKDQPNTWICPALAFPQQYRGNDVQSVLLDGATFPLRRLGRSGDGFYHTLPLGCGAHKIQVLYGGRAPALEAPP